jgi:hypothetical protein
MPIGQKLLPTPNMIRQTYRHRRTPMPITTPRRTILSTLTQTPMRTQPVALKHTQYHSRIPQTHPLRKRMRLARQTVQTIPQHPVQPLPVNHIRTLYRRPQHTTHRHTHHPAPTTTLDRLRQAHACRRHKARTTPLARTRRVPIHALHLLPIDRPPITEPRYPRLPPDKGTSLEFTVCRARTLFRPHPQPLSHCVGEGCRGARQCALQRVPPLPPCGRGGHRG